MLKRALFAVCAAMFVSMQPAAAQSAPVPALPQYDAELARPLGGDDSGMRSYVLVILKTGPNKVADPAERKKMFQGHFANMERLAAEKKLAFAGPLDGVEGRRGIFILATPDIELAKSYVATDPVIVNGEMVAEYHKLFGSAALMMVNDVHNKIRKK
ncbi:MAG TPA: YciI family protein [Telluria sp.]